MIRCGVYSMNGSAMSREGRIWAIVASILALASAVIAYYQLVVAKQQSPPASSIIHIDPKPIEHLPLKSNLEELPPNVIAIGNHAQAIGTVNGNVLIQGDGE